MTITELCVPTREALDGEIDGHADQSGFAAEVGLDYWPTTEIEDLVIN
jgi:hypothetical protein